MPKSLRQMREAMSLTQTQAAAFLGVSQASLGAWERGEARPSLEKITPLARLYGQPVEAVLLVIVGE